MTDKTTAEVMIPALWMAEAKKAMAGPTIYEKLGIKRPDYLPTPWYGHVRNWLSKRLDRFTCWAENAAIDLRYYPRVDPDSLETVDLPLGKEIEFHTAPFTAVNVVGAEDPYRYSYGMVPYWFGRRTEFEVDEPHG
jgi:hypothetical protein